MARMATTTSGGITHLDHTSAESPLSLDRCTRRQRLCGGIPVRVGVATSPSVDKDFTQIPS